MDTMRKRLVVVTLVLAYILLAGVLLSSRPLTANTTFSSIVPPVVGTVRGGVFHDVNGNGAWDVGESGIANVTIRLYPDATPAISTTLTNASGHYTFTDVLLGSYTVVETDPFGYESTTPNLVAMNLVAEGQVLTVNFGDRAVGRIETQVFVDANLNGVQDGSEVGLADARVVLWREGTPILTGTTGTNGGHNFPPLPLGDYEVRETDPLNYASTTPNVVTVTLTVPGQLEEVAFGDMGTGRVEGVLFDDRNANGDQDPGEPGIAGAIVSAEDSSLLMAGGVRAPTAVVTRMTAADGSYVFEALWSGRTYTVRKPTLPGYVDTTPPFVQVELPGPGDTGIADFGVQPQATIYGKVYNDLNENGAWDVGEPGLGGVRIDLSGNTSLTAYTLSDGTYAFQDIPLGDYTVQETDPSGFTSTTSNTVPASLVTALENVEVNFGDVGLPGNVHGGVFEDLDGDGVWDAWEVGLAGVTIELWQSGNLLDSTTTDGDGAYSFTSLTPGAYTVQEIDPPGYISTTPNQRSVSVPPGGSATANFGDQPTGLISGVVFNDRNGNGVQNVGEEGLVGITVTLKSGGSVISVTTTGASGYYGFPNLTPGDYVVEETLPLGYANTTPLSVPVNLLPNSSANVHFGNQGIGLVSGVVFNDFNGDGLPDITESGIPGVTIRLLEAGVIISTTLTASDGAYTFTNIPAGTYTVREIDLPGYVSVMPNDVVVTFGAGGSAFAHFGDQLAGVIGGVAFHDLDGNGAQGAGEDGLASVTIQLWQDSALIASTTTNSAGAYSFSNIFAGTYDVRSISPAGFVRTTPAQVTVSVAQGGSANANFGFQQMGTVSGAAFNDLNGNGIRDAGEPGFSSVLITLTNGVITLTRSTAGGGSYLFTDVLAGNYTISAAEVANFARTTLGAYSISVAVGGSANASFGYQESGLVSGRVFNDLNGNGVLDVGESGLGGVVISLSDGVDTVTATTASNGNYSFNGVVPGDYTLSAAEVPGFMRTTPGTVNLTVPPGGSVGRNFGYQEVGTIGGVVFNDLNGNGARDVGELGIGGVVVSLSNGLTTTTTGGGQYSFGDLAPGSYTVQATTPSGFINTTATSVGVLLLPGGSAGADFGFQGQGTVGGVVFNDLNGNGVRDAGEPGIGGVTVRLEGEQIFQTVTAGDGSYGFSDVPAGDYVARATAPTGFSHTTPQMVGISLAPGGSAGASFGMQGYGTVSGVAFRDSNANGNQDAGEPGLGGVVISLIGPGGTLTTTTLSNGSYSFSDVVAGNYTVESTVPGGYVRTTTGAVLIVVTANGGANVDFGFQGQGMVGGVVFNDRNGNGVREVGEPGIGGVVVTLTNGSTVITTTTSGDGQYSFSEQAEGNYTVSAEVPHYVHTTPGTVAVVILPGSGASASFGFQGRGTVGGVVFNDANGNGIQDAGEGGLGGVTITLNGEAISTTTTAGDGSYGFNAVPAGDYTVVATTPAGFAPTTATSQPVLVAPDGSAGANFGFRHQGMLGGVVFRDANANGLQDAGEMGIGGLTVTLDGPWPQSTTTAADGSYGFANLPPGSYTIYITPPEGFVATTANPVIVSLAAGGSAGANFGFQGRGTVAGIAFNDANGNGSRDAGEANIGGLIITLTPTSGPALTTTTTVGDGSYQFTGVAEGGYTVAAAAIPGFVRTTPGTVAIAVTPQGSAGANFGYQEMGLVSGVVFRDVDGDGTRDAGEPGIGGVVITLTTETNATFTTVTSGDGAYSFSNVAVGNHTVAAAPLPGFVRTTQGVVNVTVNPGGSANANFGYQQIGVISGVVFNDRNGNGFQDAGEPGLGGVLVSYSGGATTTAGDGTYLFENVLPGSYSIAAANITGFVRTTPSPVGVLVTDGGSANANFGYQPQGTLGGVVFNDFNGNGLPDAGEPGISGVLITLEGPGGPRTRLTAGDGSYLFSDLGPGEYTVAAADVVSFTRTSPAAVTLTLADNGSATANFGYQQEGTVSGVVFHDANGDGLQNAGEPGIGGVLISLLDGGVLTTTTSGDGRYAFFGVGLGAYTVEETDPVGFTSTTPNSVPITLTAVAPSASVNFGDVPIGVISGVVFNDLDEDGVQDAGEMGLGGVWVILRSGEEILAQVQTVGNGSYMFSVAPGDYAVSIVRPAGFVATTPTQVNVTVALGGSATANFGLRPGGRLFLPLIFRNYPLYELRLPLVMRNYVPPQHETLPFRLGFVIAQRPAQSVGEVFYTRAFKMPPIIPTTGAFYLSRQADAVTSVQVEDELVFSLDGVEIFTRTFVAGPGVAPVRALVEVDRAVLEQLAGQTLTVSYRDLYGDTVAADELWLLWIP